MNAMWEEIKNVNRAKEIQSIKVPTFFFEGKYDMATSKVPIEEFYDTLDAEKGKKRIIFEKSAKVLHPTIIPLLFIGQVSLVIIESEN